MAKPFGELTEDEATDLACQIVRSSQSEDEIKRRLTEAGFNGTAAVICSQSMFQAMVMVYGPGGEIISV